VGWPAESTTWCVSTMVLSMGAERLACSSGAGLGVAGAASFLALLPEMWSVANPHPLLYGTAPF
jgi:hypothetical protein